MGTEWILSTVIGIGSLCVSVGSTLAIISFRTGQYLQRVRDLETALSSKANASDLTSIKESLAEIKGMFVLRLRE